MSRSRWRESWVLTEKLESKLQALEMKFLRSVKSDTIRSDVVRTELKVGLNTSEKDISSG